MTMTMTEKQDTCPLLKIKNKDPSLIFGVCTNFNISVVISRTTMYVLLKGVDLLTRKR